MPPMVIFKGKRLKSEFGIGSSEGTIIQVSDNGWINTEIFTEWSKEFAKFISKDDDKPHVLLMDGHSNHIYNSDFIEISK